ncbi:MAG: CBS domain-containing protein [Piscirickettsiaceae bacterium]|nr:CBS domain-containing protein [Piscirickettsiaceae bacterium]
MLASLKVKDYMTVNKCTFTPDMDILRAIHKMLESRISGAPVLDVHGNMIGFLSEKDCMQVALNAGYNQDGAAGRVSEFMSNSVDTIEVDAPILEVAERFLKGSFKRFPVVKDNRLVGTITRQNILRALEYLSDPESTHSPNKKLAHQSVHS